MKYPTIFHLISDISAKKGTSCVLIGGFALNYYKITRQTADVDFLTTREDYEKISSLLEKEGLRQDYIQEVFVRLVSQKEYLMDLDFMFVDAKTLKAIIKDGKEATIAGQKFIVPSLHHLIALKLHAVKHNPQDRELKDFLDIVELIKANGLDAKSAHFKSLCLQYGTEACYQKILDWVRQ